MRPDSGSPSKPFVSIVIPALNEEAAIGDVVRAIPRDIVDEVIVADNGSTDATATVAATAGARIAYEPVAGYGRACMAGAMAVDPRCDIVVFLDGDGSDCPQEMAALLAPILAGEKDFVIGSRARGRCEPGALSPQQRFAAFFAGFLMSRYLHCHYTDMGPFRAIRRSSLLELRMREMTYGWNIEMQMRAAQEGLRVLEVPVSLRKRQGGVSKVSGNFYAVLKAGTRIVMTVVRVARMRKPQLG